MARRADPDPLFVKELEHRLCREIQAAPRVAFWDWLLRPFGKKLDLELKALEAWIREDRETIANTKNLPQNRIVGFHAELEKLGRKFCELKPRDRALVAAEIQRIQNEHDKLEQAVEALLPETEKVAFKDLVKRTEPRILLTA